MSVASNTDLIEATADTRNMRLNLLAFKNKTLTVHFSLQNSNKTWELT